MPDEYSGDAKVRPCPTCRMLIPILATKCRFCNVEVGRPRQEAETLTIRDLGGETTGNYQVSDNVIDALKSFREDVVTRQETERRAHEESRHSWFGKRHPHDSAPPPAQNLPELDAEHRALADAISGQTTPPPSYHAPRGGPDVALLTKRVFTVAALAASLVILYLSGDLAWARIREYMENRNAVDVPRYENLALDMINRGRPTIEAYREALSAIALDSRPEQKEILAEVRSLLIEEVTGLLEADPWKPRFLNQASELATQAANLDRDRDVQTLRRRVNGELAAYRTVLFSVSGDGAKATFRLHDPSFPEGEQTVGAGDYVLDRFLVREIRRSSVLLEDTEIQAGNRGRRLIAPLRSQLQGH